MATSLISTKTAESPTPLARQIHQIWKDDEITAAQAKQKAVIASICQRIQAPYSSSSSEGSLEPGDWLSILTEIEKQLKDNFIGVNLTDGQEETLVGAINVYLSSFRIDNRLMDELMQWSNHIACSAESSRIGNLRTSLRDQLIHLNLQPPLSDRQIMAVVAEARANNRQAFIAAICTSGMEDNNVVSDVLVDSLIDSGLQSQIVGHMEEIARLLAVTGITKLNESLGEEQTANVRKLTEEMLALGEGIYNAFSLHRDVQTPVIIQKTIIRIIQRYPRIVDQLRLAWEQYPELTYAISSTSNPYIGVGGNAVINYAGIEQHDQLSLSDSPGGNLLIHAARSFKFAQLIILNTLESILGAQKDQKEAELTASRYLCNVSRSPGGRRELGHMTRVAVSVLPQHGNALKAPSPAERDMQSIVRATIYDEAVKFGSERKADQQLPLETRSLLDMGIRVVLVELLRNDVKEGDRHRTFGALTAEQRRNFFINELPHLGDFTAEQRRNFFTVFSQYGDLNDFSQFINGTTFTQGHMKHYEGLLTADNLVTVLTNLDHRIDKGHPDPATRAIQRILDGHSHSFFFFRTGFDFGRVLLSGDEQQNKTTIARLLLLGNPVINERLLACSRTRGIIEDIVLDQAKLESFSYRFKRFFGIGEDDDIKISILKVMLCPAAFTGVTATATAQHTSLYNVLLKASGGQQTNGPPTTTVSISSALSDGQGGFSAVPSVSPTDRDTPVEVKAESVDDLMKDISVLIEKIEHALPALPENDFRAQDMSLVRAQINAARGIMSVINQPSSRGQCNVQQQLRAQVVALEGALTTLTLKPSPESTLGMQA